MQRSSCVRARARAFVNSFDSLTLFCAPWMLPRSPSFRPTLGPLTLPPAEAGAEDWDASPKYGCGPPSSERLPRVRGRR